MKELFIKGWRGYITLSFCVKNSAIKKKLIVFGLIKLLNYFYLWYKNSFDIFLFILFFLIW